MTTLIIHDVDKSLATNLYRQATLHGNSVEEEACNILREALPVSIVPKSSLIAAIRARIAPLGGLTLTLPEREAVRNPPDLA